MTKLKIMFLLKKHEEVAFKRNHSLSPKEKKYCSCVIKVSEKQGKKCLKSGGAGCYNPYAVCKSSTHVGYAKCGENYDFDSFTMNQLLAYADSRNVDLPVSHRKSKQKVLDAIHQYKMKENMKKGTR